MKSTWHSWDIRERQAAVSTTQQYSVRRTNNPLSSFPAGNVLAQPIPANFFPFDLLSRDGQLSSQVLERALGHLDKRAIELLLVFPLGGCDAGDDGLGGERWDGDVDRLVGVQRDVSVLVVVHIDMDLAGHGRRFGDGDLVNRAEAAVPITSTMVRLSID